MRDFLQKMAWRSERFMRGRNGMDDCTRGVYYASVVLLILSLFIRSTVMNLLVTVTIGYALFRMLSRNIDARQRENVKYLNMTSSIRAKFGRGGNGGYGSASGKFSSVMSDAKKKAEQQKLRFDERKEFKFFKCKCGATLRVRRGQGTKELSCPICHEKMTRNTD